MLERPHLILPLASEKRVSAEKYLFRQCKRNLALVGILAGLDYKASRGMPAYCVQFQAVALVWPDDRVSSQFGALRPVEVSEPTLIAKLGRLYRRSLVERRPVVLSFLADYREHRFWNLRQVREVKRPERLVGVEPRNLETFLQSLARVPLLNLSGDPPARTRPIVPA